MPRRMIVLLVGLAFGLVSCFAANQQTVATPGSLGLAGQSVQVDGQLMALAATKQALEIQKAEATAVIQATVDADARAFTNKSQALQLQATAIAQDATQTALRINAAQAELQAQLAITNALQAALIQNTNIMVQATQTAQDLKDKIEQDAYNRNFGRLAWTVFGTAVVLLGIIGCALIIRYLNTRTSVIDDKNHGTIVILYNWLGQPTGGRMLLAGPPAQLQLPQGQAVVSHQGQTFESMASPGLLVRDRGHEKFYPDDPDEQARRRQIELDRRHALLLLSRTIGVSDPDKGLVWTEQSATLPGWRLLKWPSSKWTEYITPLQTAGYVESQSGRGEDSGNRLVGEYRTVMSLYHRIRDHGL